MSDATGKPYVDEIAEEALEVLVSSLEERLRGPFSRAVNDGLDRAGLEKSLVDLQSSLGDLVTPKELRQRSEEIVSQLDRLGNLIARKEQVEYLDQQVKAVDRKLTDEVNVLKAQSDAIRGELAAFAEKSDRQMEKVHGALALVLDELALMQRAEAAIQAVFRQLSAGGQRQWSLMPLSTVLKLRSLIRLWQDCRCDLLWMKY